MKKLFIIAFLLPYSLCFNQEYLPLVVEDNEWNVLVEVEAGPYPWMTEYWTESFKLSGDTLINELTYKKVHKSEEEFPVNWQYWGGIREENQQVWYIGINNYPERELYDFTFNVGDTVSFLYEPMIVDSVVYKPVNGEARKHIYFSYNGNTDFTEVWIEGIGSDRGVLQSGTATFVGGWTWLLCKSENGEQVYQNPDYASCYMISTGIDESKIGAALFISPNPTSGKFEVRSSKFEVSIPKIISIYNLQGIKMEETRLNGKLQNISMNAEGWPAGIYFLRLECNGESLFSKLIVK